jgi:hypothetical protein
MSVGRLPITLLDTHLIGKCHHFLKARAIEHAVDPRLETINLEKLHHEPVGGMQCIERVLVCVAIDVQFALELGRRKKRLEFGEKLFCAERVVAAEHATNNMLHTRAKRTGVGHGAGLPEKNLWTQTR